MAILKVDFTALFPSVRRIRRPVRARRTMEGEAFFDKGRESGISDERFGTGGGNQQKPPTSLQDPGSLNGVLFCRDSNDRRTRFSRSTIGVNLLAVGKNLTCP